MAYTNITMRVDEDLKRESENLFADFGLTMNAAFIMFLKQSVREQRIPFEIRRVNTEITMATKEQIEKASQELIDKNRTAYEELAK